MKVSDLLRKAAAAFERVEVVENDLDKYSDAAGEQTEERQETMRLLEETAEEASNESLRYICRALYKLRLEKPVSFREFIDRFTVVRNIEPEKAEHRNNQIAEFLKDVHSPN